MALTKRKRYLFCMDKEPGRTHEALELLQKITGTTIIFAAAYMLGQALSLSYEFYYRPFWQWWREAILQSGLAFFPYLITVCLFCMCIGMVLRLANVVFRTRSLLLSVLCALLVVAPITARIATEGGEPLTPVFLFLCVMMGMLGPLVPDDDTPALLADLGCIEDQGDLTAIVLESSRETIVLAALERINDPVELRRIVRNERFLSAISSLVWESLLEKITEKTLLLELAGNPRLPGIRQNACRKLGHIFDGADSCCSRCGATSKTWSANRHLCPCTHCEGRGTVEAYSCESGNGDYWQETCVICKGTGVSAYEERNIETACRAVKENSATFPGAN